MFRREKIRHYLIIFLLSISAIFIHGYQFAVSDQEVFIPYILKLQDPSLFPDDLLFEQSSASTSVFYPLYGFLTKFVDLEVLFFVSFFIFQILFFLAVFKLSYVILKNKTLAYLSLPLFFLPKFIGGTATSTFDDFFGYRSIGVIFLLFYISNLLEYQFKKAAIFAAIGFAFHPLSIIPNLILLPVLLMRNKLQLSPQGILKILALLIILALPIAAFLQKDDSWLSIIKFRDSYLFLSQWQLLGLLSFFLYISLIFFLLTKIQSRIKSTILLTVTICLVLFITNFITLELFKNPEIAKFQLARSITPIAYIALAMCPLLLIKGSFQSRAAGFLSFVSLVANLFELFLVFFIIYVFFNLISKSDSDTKMRINYLILLFTTIVSLNFILGIFQKDGQYQFQYPKPASDWIKLQQWANTNTDKSALFLVPVDQTGFRIYSKRPIVADIKDGAVVIYSRDNAILWYRRYTDVKNFYQYPSGESLEDIARKYPISYLVTRKDFDPALKKVHENESYAIYQVK